MAGPVGAVGGAEGLPFTGEAWFGRACWLSARPPTTAGEPLEALIAGESCEPFVAFAYEERPLADVPEAADEAADLAWLALMGVEEDCTVLVIRGVDEASGHSCAVAERRVAFSCGFGVALVGTERVRRMTTSQRSSLQVAHFKYY